MTAVNNDDIERVRVAVNSREPLMTRVVIDLARKIPYTVETVGEELRVLFKNAVDKARRHRGGDRRAGVAPPVAEPPAAEPVAVAADVAPAAEPPIARRRQRGHGSADAGDRRRAVDDRGRRRRPRPRRRPLRRAVAPPMQDVPPSAPRAADGRRSSRTAPSSASSRGDPITLDFQGADLRAVLRTFAEISQGLNIVIDPSIQGTVDVSLRDVPWDQALDIILRANKLGYSVEGNIVRIVPLNVLAQENEERRKLRKRSRWPASCASLTRAVSYAKAADLVPVITRSALSARGDVQVDARTNTLIIRDLADRLRRGRRPDHDARPSAAAGRDRSAHRAAQSRQARATSASSGASTAASIRRWAPAPASRSRTAARLHGAGTGGRATDGVSPAPSASCSARSTARSISTCSLRALESDGRAEGAVDAARDDAEQHPGGNHAGRADSDSGGLEQHRDGDLQGRGADAARDAADHRLEHGDHEHLPRERDAGLHARPARRSRFRRSTRSAR